PTAHGPWPPAAGQFTTPQWGYPAPVQHRTWRPVVIVGTVVLVAVVIVATTLLVAMLHSPSDQAPTPPAPTTYTHVYQLAPGTRLPSDDQVSQATTLTLQHHGPQQTKVSPDSTATPPVCILASAPTTESSWSTAQSIAGQLYTDAAQNNSVGVLLAVFDTPTDVSAALNKVVDSVTNCAMPYTETDSQTSKSVTWQITDVHRAESRITWTSAVTRDGTPWRCGNDYRIEANVTAATVVCGPDLIEDAAAQIDDMVITAATR
ncbi:MAG: sensor domain-containing protein, partial [Mycobacterium sp.]